jgi:hypothetical protein
MIAAPRSRRRQRDTNEEPEALCPRSISPCIECLPACCRGARPTWTSDDVPGSATAKRGVMERGRSCDGARSCVRRAIRSKVEERLEGGPEEEILEVGEGKRGKGSSHVQPLRMQCRRSVCGFMYEIRRVIVPSRCDAAKKGRPDRLQSDLHTNDPPFTVQFPRAIV